MREKLTENIADRQYMIHKTQKQFGYKRLGEFADKHTQTFLQHLEGEIN